MSAQSDKILSAWKSGEMTDVAMMASLAKLNIHGGFEKGANKHIYSGYDYTNQCWVNTIEPEAIS